MIVFAQKSWRMQFICTVWVAAASCSSAHDGRKSTSDDCWQALRSAYFELHGFAETTAIDSKRASEVRYSIGPAVQSCLRLGRNYGTLFTDPWPADRQDELTLLDFAALGNDLALAQELLDAGFTAATDPTGKASHHATGGNALHLASYFSADRVVALLLKSGVAPDSRGSDGTTPLMISWAMTVSGQTATRALLQAGADVNATNDRGHTALFHAVNRGDQAKIEILIDFGADTTIVYGDSGDIFEFATKAGRLAELEIIRSRRSLAPR